MLYNVLSCPGKEKTKRKGCEVHKQDELVCTFHLVLVVSFFIPSFFGRRRVKNHVVFTHSVTIPQPEDDGARGAGFGAGGRHALPGKS